MRVRRLLAALTVVAASALVFSPAAAAQARYEPRFKSAPCPQFSLPALENADCGFLVVPENRSQPEGRLRGPRVAVA
jgi:hypothetical protein